MSAQALWTALVVVVALVITLFMVWARRDFAFGLVVIWASIGIALNRAATPIIFSTSIAVAIIVAILIVLAPFLKRKSITDFYMMRNGH
jgi:hypothetical protein